MTFRDIPDAWQTKVQRLLPFPIFWISVAAIVLAISYAVLRIYEESMDYMILIILETVILAALANGAVFFETLLDEVADTFPALLDQETDLTDQWLRKWYQNIFWSNTNIYVGLIFAIGFVAMGFNVIPNIFSSLPGQIMAFSLLAILGVLSGSLSWVMLGIARMTSSLGREVHIRPSIFDTSTSPLRAAASIMWKVSLIGTLLFVLGISIYPLCLIGVTKTHFVVNMLGGVCIFLYFIIPQVNIHKSLKTIKQSRLDDLVGQIDTTFDGVAESPSMDNISKLKELLNLQAIVDRKNSWSFGTKELLTLVSSIVIPLILFAINYFRQGD